MNPPPGQPPRPPGGQQPQHPQPHGRQAPPPYGAPGQGPRPQPPREMPQAPLVMPRKRPGRGALRFVAHSCVASAWITLLGSLLLSVMMFVSAANMKTAPDLRAPAPTFSLPGSGGDAMNPDVLIDPSSVRLPDLGGAGGGTGDLNSALQSIMPSTGAIFRIGLVWSGVITLVSGIMLFFLFLGLGQACYAIIDLEQKQYDLADLMQHVMARTNR